MNRRLTYEALWFVQHYVFPTSHADLLAVRGKYKKHDAGEEMQPSVEGASGDDSDADRDQET